VSIVIFNLDTHMVIGYCRERTVCYTHTMNERSQPYVGVSGVVTHKNIQPSGLVVTEPQALWLQGYAETAGLFDKDRRLALGVKAVHQTQWDDRPMVRSGREYGEEWYPVGADGVRDIIAQSSRHANTLGVMQMYFDRKKVHDEGYRNMFMSRTAFRCRKWVDAVQFDSLPWHEDESLFRSLDFARNELAGMTTIVQCHEQAMQNLGVAEIMKVLGRHADSIDYVLFDASHGMGKTLDVEALDVFLESAYASDRLSHAGFAVAGGLDARTVEELLPYLLAKYADLSWDAEGKLHPLNNVGKRPLQMDTVKKYLQSSANVI
jgi:phosphoribosylanthranilate isomerase